jgi:translation elongation factor EF-Tu-like GTPase
LDGKKYLNMADLIKVLAKIEYQISKEGRQGSFQSGYRPAFTFQNAPTKISGRIDLINKDTFIQGDIGIVDITFIKCILDETYFIVGEKFTFAEEPHQVGNGEIMEVTSK